MHEGIDYRRTPPVPPRTITGGNRAEFKNQEGVALDNTSISETHSNSEIG